MQICCTLVRAIMGKTKKKYYAVKVGRIPGVYNSWTECEAQVKKHPGAVYKGFADFFEAEAFVNSPGRGYGYSKKPSSSSTRQKYTGEFTRKRTQIKKLPSCTKDTSTNPDIAILQPVVPLSTFIIRGICGGVVGSDDSRPVVYTDGCCFRNGGTEPRGGIGVYWGQGSLHNISERLQGVQTNQRAELVAACRAIESAVQQGHTSVEIRTDSTYAIKSATEWIEKWKGNGWITADRKPVKNKDDMQRLDHLCKLLDIKWTHVKGHVGIPGNEAADSLAKAGSQKLS